MYTGQNVHWQVKTYTVRSQNVHYFLALKKWLIVYILTFVWVIMYTIGEKGEFEGWFEILNIQDRLVKHTWSRGVGKYKWENSTGGKRTEEKTCGETSSGEK